MKIAVFIEEFDPAGGGAQRSTQQIVSELTLRGHEVTIFTASSPLVGPQPVGTPPRMYQVVRMAERLRLHALNVWRWARWARGQLARGQFDSSLSVTTTVPAHVVQPRSGTARETLNRNIAMRRSAAARFWKAQLAKLSAKQRLLLKLERATIGDPRVQRFAAVSGYVAKQLKSQYAVADARIVVIPNASSMPVVDAAQREAWRTQVRSGFGVPEDATAFVFAAFNPRLKGGMTLLHAARHLQDRGYRFVLLIAGNVSYGLQNDTAKLGVREVVRMVGPTGRMAELYAAADVTVLPTYYDPSSKVVIESLMMGTPAISTSFNGASDFIVENGQTRGRVVQDPGDPRKLADAMGELCDPAERARCRAACAGLAERLSMRTHVEHLERVLAEAGKAGNGRQG